MAFEQILKKSLDPKIALVEHSEIDDSNEVESASIHKKSSDRPSTAQSTGSKKPFIKINGRSIDSVEYFMIDETDFVPTVTLIFIDSTGEFNGTRFPKRDQVMSSYIKTANDKFKPLRHDWLITSIRSMGNKQKASEIASTGIEYVIKGELYLPRFYNNVSKSYASMTSRDALFKVAEELGIGFAENSTAPADSMTWINFNTSPANFIKDVISHAYQDTDSFFTSFINKEYCLCYVNVNQQMLQQNIDETFATIIDPTARDRDKINKQTTGEDTVINFLTTTPTSKGMPNYITSASMVSDQGQILKSNGYKKKLYYYDYLLDAEPSEKFIDFFIAPTNTVGRTVDETLTPENEGLDEIGLKKWLNVDYGNTHTKWNLSRVMNEMNLKEADKINLKVSLEGINVQVIRGGTVALLITQTIAQKVLKDLDQTDSAGILNEPAASTDFTIDTQLSAYYWVKGARYYYDGSNQSFETELILSRREWQPSKKIKTINV